MKYAYDIYKSYYESVGGFNEEMLAGYKTDYASLCDSIEDDNYSNNGKYKNFS